MIDANTFITQSLSPAIAISGVGLLVLGLNNRIATLGSRIRQLNRERRHIEDPGISANMAQQVMFFIRRATMVRNALFLLYTAIGLIVLTEFSLALVAWGIVTTMVPVGIFLLALSLIFLAVLFEAYETMLNVKTLHLDIEYGGELNGNGQASARSELLAC